MSVLKAHKYTISAIKEQIDTYGKKNTHKHVKWKSRILSIFMKGHNMECNFHTMALNYASAISIVSHDHERRLSW